MNYYKVKEFSDLTSIPLSTLHYYDEIGLLKPSYTTDNGDQFYSNNDVLRLSHIMGLQFMGLTLEQIKPIVMNTPDPKSGLKDLHKMMHEEIEKLNRLAELADAMDKNLCP